MRAGRHIEDDITAIQVRHCADGHAYHHHVGAGQRFAAGTIANLPGDLAGGLAVQKGRGER